MIDLWHAVLATYLEICARWHARQYDRHEQRLGEIAEKARRLGAASTARAVNRVPQR